MEIIGYMRCGYKEKFGIPRQSGLAPSARGFVEMVSPYNQAEAFRGLCDFSHIWLLWDFSRAHQDRFCATVKPPKLGGNTRMGVWATRSPNRPNHIGLSSVKLDEIVYDEKTGCVTGLLVSGADILDGTPIYDIKPYLPRTDCHPDASDGWTENAHTAKLRVVIPDDVADTLPAETLVSLTEILGEDPRPGYQDEPDKVYGMLYAGYDIHFTIAGGCATIVNAVPATS